MKLIILMLICQHALAIEAQDNYYSDDLENAVHQAKENPHHYDYSSNYRYKRTTAQSIELNRLNLSELDETRLEITENETDNTNIASASKLSAEQINASDSNKLTLKPTELPNIKILTPTLNSQYKSNYGDYRTTGIQHDGIVISTPRP